MFASIGKEMDNLFSDLTDKVKETTDSYQSKDYQKESKSTIITLRIGVDRPFSLKSICQKIIDDSPEIDILTQDISKVGRYYA